MEKEHFEILLEHMRSEFRAVAAGHESLRQELGRKIDDFRDEVNDRFKVVDTQILALNYKIEAVDEKLSNRIDAVETKLSIKIDAVAQDIAEHRADTEVHRAHG
ncbi:hypothetical protein [Desulfurispira natronophila]|uniref:Uncharacterized protein n=1 Tax=Desulfurispira natronophila TaxID=682562 RepID=A0A7W7Y4I8_9BACT|nr:hypothetical protein [Desulfurispira natronophila]MBB5021956.1 hypothetical protein [Desulfurispira natronophila]